MIEYLTNGSIELLSKKRTEGDTFSVQGQEFIVRRGIPRLVAKTSVPQEQTGAVFGSLWHRCNELRTPDTNRNCIASLNLHFPHRDRYLKELFSAHQKALVLDAGCGMWLSGSLCFHNYYEQLHYVAVDISDSIDVAKRLLDDAGVENICLQADIASLPFEDNTFDCVYCPYVLQHTDDPHQSLRELIRIGKPGALYILFCTRPAPPIRKYADGLIREMLKTHSPEEVTRLVEPLTQLAYELSKISGTITVEQDIPWLAVPKGSYGVHEFIYDFILRVAYRHGETFQLNNLMNVDWYGPLNYIGVPTEEFTAWCDEDGVELHEKVVIAGSTSVIGRKRRFALDLV